MSRLTAIISAVVICLIVSLGWLANHYHTNATEFKTQRDDATAKADNAQTVSNNGISAMNFINAISQATKNAQTQLVPKGEERIVYIRQALEGDRCAKQLVPASAADSQQGQTHRPPGGFVI